MNQGHAHQARAVRDLIDALYEHRVKLLAARRRADRTDLEGDGRFEFARTAAAS